MQREEQEDKPDGLFVAALINEFQIEPWRKLTRARKTPRGFPIIEEFKNRDKGRSCGVVVGLCARGTFSVH